MVLLQDVYAKRAISSDENYSYYNMTGSTKHNILIMISLDGLFSYQPFPAKPNELNFDKWTQAHFKISSMKAP